jgi:hypothetical protein
MRCRIVYWMLLNMMLVPLFVLTGGCSGKSEPQVEVWEDGVYFSTVVDAYEVSGKRDGAVTRVSAELILESGERLRIELEVGYNPQPVLGEARWLLGTDPGTVGEVKTESLKFLGGQGEGPSFGGRFRLEENGTPRFRVVLPLRPVDRPEWKVD